MKFEKFLEGKKEFRAAFLGGSITEGVGCSTTSKRYTSQIVERLNRRLPEINFIEINAGVGGTPSALGLFRLDYEVLSKNPDILFVEFAVNDTGAEVQMSRYLEGIVRNARRRYPELPIVFLYTYGAHIINTTRENPSFVIKEQTKVADAYGIPHINMGYDLYDKIMDYGGDNLVYTVDGGHPNDAGYSVYADSIMRDLFRVDFTFEFPKDHITNVEFPHPVLMPCMDIEKLPEGWGLSGRTLTANQSLHYIFSDIPGASITFEFEGTACGLYIRIEKDGGQARVTIDGKDMGLISFWDRFSPDLDRDGFLHIAEGLKYGKHTFTVTVSDEKKPLSEGHVARIAAFLAG